MNSVIITFVVQLFFTRYLFSTRSGSLVKILSFICVFATFFGLAALIIVTSVMNGLNRNVKARLLKYEPHLVVESSVAGKSDLMGFSELKRKHQAQFFRFERQDIIVRTLDGYFHSVEAVGVGESKDHFLYKEIYRKGEDQEEGFVVQEELKDNEVYIGRDLAFQLNVFEGSELLLIPPETLLLPKDQIPNYQRVTIKKVLSTEIRKIDAKMVFYSLNSGMSRGMSLRKGWEVRLKEPQNFEPLMQDLRREGYSVESWVDRNGTLFAALKMEKIAMTVFLGFSALITSFIIFSVLTLLITQKKREMGVLMSLGLSRGSVRRLFFSLGLVLSLIGVVGGILFGVSVSYMIDLFPIPILPDIYYDRSFPAKVDLVSVVLTTLFGVLMSVLSAWIPTRVLKSVTASESLRAL